MIRRERDERLFKAGINLAARRYKLTHEAAVMLLSCEIAEALRKGMTREGLPRHRLPNVLVWFNRAVGIQLHHSKRLRMLLAALDTALSIEDMNAPGFPLHP